MRSFDGNPKRHAGTPERPNTPTTTSTVNRRVQAYTTDRSDVC